MMRKKTVIFIALVCAVLLAAYYPQSYDGSYPCRKITQGQPSGEASVTLDLIRWHSLLLPDQISGTWQIVPDGIIFRVQGSANPLNLQGESVLLLNAVGYDPALDAMTFSTLCLHMKGSAFVLQTDACLYAFPLDSTGEQAQELEILLGFVGK